jgi:hypothetical protein
MMWTVPVEDDSLTPEDVKNALKSLAIPAMHPMVHRSHPLHRPHQLQVSSI